MLSHRFSTVVQSRTTTGAPFLAESHPLPLWRTIFTSVFLAIWDLCVEDQLNVQLVPSSGPSLVPSSLGHYTSSIRFFWGTSWMRSSWMLNSSFPMFTTLEDHGPYDLPSEHMNWQRGQTSCWSNNKDHGEIWMILTLYVEHACPCEVTLLFSQMPCCFVEKRMCLI